MLCDYLSYFFAFSKLNSNSLKYKGVFEGNVDSTTISPGIYQIDAYSTLEGTVPTGRQYEAFVQMPGGYKVQILVGQKLVARRYVGSPQIWSSWA